MIPGATPFKVCYLGSLQRQMLNVALGQQGTEPKRQCFAVSNGCQLVDSDPNTGSRPFLSSSRNFHSIGYDEQIYSGREDLGLENLRSAISAFIQERDWEQFHSPKNLAMALSVEVAEIVEHFQWLTEEDSKNLPPGKLAEVREEIGDVMIYLTELADKLGIDPVEAAKAKMTINGQKYPAELVRGKASKYTEYA